MNTVQIPAHLKEAFKTVITPEAEAALQAIAPLHQKQQELMHKRTKRRAYRIANGHTPNFLAPDTLIGHRKLKVEDIRQGDFCSSIIPQELQKQWIQGTGPATRPGAPVEKSLRNVAYALLSGADGWMFDGEDALGQVGNMSLENQRNLKMAIHRQPQFMQVAEAVSHEMNSWGQSFFGKEIVADFQKQLNFTTVLFRPRGLHLADRHVRTESGEPFSASITDLVLYVANNHQQLNHLGQHVVLYLPKIQTAEEAAFWDLLLSELERYFCLPLGRIKAYVLVEQLEAAFQLLEIRAALGEHFVGFNTGRWDYINSVSDALAGVNNFQNPDIEAVGMTYAYMAAYEHRVRQAVNTPDRNGRFSLWQGGMEPNIPVGAAEGVAASMKKAIAGAKREQQAGASGKWVAHWKMVHIVRPVWEEAAEANQLGRNFGALSYTDADRQLLMSLQAAPRTVQGARNLISVAIQYGNAFLQGYQAAALKPADFFEDDNTLYLMEDMATGEIRVSVLWEWLHKKAAFTEADEAAHVKAGDVFTSRLFEQLLEEEYRKLQAASAKDVHAESKESTLPIAHEIVAVAVRAGHKAPWFIDLLNLMIGTTDRSKVHKEIARYYQQLCQNKRVLLPAEEKQAAPAPALKFA